MLAKFSLGVEGVVGLAAGGDDGHEHGAALGLGLGDGVVEALLQGEGLLQGGRRVVHRLGERAGALGSELGDGQVEFLAAAADGFVGGDELLVGELLEGLHRQGRKAPGVGGFDGAGVLEDGGLVLLPLAARVGVDAATGGDGRCGTAAQPGERLAGHLPGGGGGLDCGVGGPVPVVGGQVRERGVGHPVDLGLRPLVAAVDGELAVLGGHGHDHGVAAAVGLHGAVGPLLGAQAPEAGGR